MTVTYRTMVLRVPPTPLGLLPERWVLDHWCNDCRQRVATHDLVAHAQHHECLPDTPAEDTMTGAVATPDLPKEVLRD
jgi:hypothetical protein